jgi:hypothetical protein
MIVLDLKPSILIEVSACSLDDKAVLFRLASFLLEAIGSVPFGVHEFASVLLRGSCCLIFNFRRSNL